MKWEFAPDIQEQLPPLVKRLSFNHVNLSRVYCFRSYGSKSRARARIWSLPFIWQKALGTAPAYCLEIIAERFDKLKEEDRTRILIHELLHIPKNFSGNLVAHRKLGGQRFDKYVENLFQSIKD